MRELGIDTSLQHVIKADNLGDIMASWHSGRTRVGVNLSLIPDAKNGNRNNLLGEPHSETTPSSPSLDSAEEPEVITNSDNFTGTDSAVCARQMASHAVRESGRFIDPTGHVKRVRLPDGLSLARLQEVQP